MRVDWTPLRRAVRPDTRVWWRDDDAMSATPALSRLGALSEALALPVGLAVIPALAEPSLVDRVAQDAAFVPLVHGWRHANTAAAGAKKSEFQKLRPEAVAEAGAALARMRELFGARALPVFVPPWNRIAPQIAAALPGLGYAALSTYGPRDARAPLPGLNTHVDPIDWRGTRGLVDPAACIERAAAQLRDHPREPIGLLTHHLVHTPEIWDFSRAILSEMLDAGAVATPIAELIHEPT